MDFQIYPKEFGGKMYDNFHVKEGVLKILKDTFNQWNDFLSRVSNVLYFHPRPSVVFLYLLEVKLRVYNETVLKGPV